MDIETIKITIIIGEAIPRKKALREINIAPIRFICIPGVRPAIAPAIIPTTSAMINSNNIVFPDNLLLLSL